MRACQDGAERAPNGRMPQDHPRQERKEEDAIQEEQQDDAKVDEDMSNHRYHTTVVVIEKKEDFDDEKENNEPIEPVPQNATTELTEIDDDMIPMCLYRRHSLPPPQMTGRESLFTSLRRESFPRNLSRRYSLPVGDLPNSNSFDKLVEKLSSLVESSPTNGTHFDYDQRPRIVSISQSLDAKTLSSAALEASKLTSAHGLDPILLAHRPYTSEPHIAMLAHQYKLNNRLGNLAYLAKNLNVAGIMPRLHSTIQSDNKLHCLLGTSRQSLPSLSALPTSGVRLSLPSQSKGTADQQGSKGQSVTTPTKDNKYKGEGHRLSLGDTSCCADNKSDRELLMVATHSVDAICLSGVDTVDATDSSPLHSRNTHSSNHVAPSPESPNSQSMGSGKHRQLDEEIPLLQPLQNKEAASEQADAKNSHSNSSFTH